MTTTHTCADCADHPATMHPQVNIWGIPVDEQLAPLLPILWALGIDTDESCQNPNDDHGLGRRDMTQTAMIGFPTFNDAHRFMYLAAAADPSYAEYFEEPSDALEEEGFRLTVWYQGTFTEAGPLLLPGFVVEFPTAKITELTDGIRAHLRTTLAGQPQQLLLWQHTSADNSVQENQPLP